jgi:proteic killer suppression protein
MIKRFRHKGLERFFLEDDTRGIDAQFAGKLDRQLLLLNRSKAASTMNLPGWKLHPLKGDLKGKWAVWVSGNWRLVFAFDGEDATDVDLIDYH